MTKRILMAGVAVALAATSGTSLAADTIGGSFFINGNLGQSQYRVSKNDWTHRSDTAVALRFGYVWYNTVDFGVEAGFVNLGKLQYRYDDGAYKTARNLKIRGALVGVNGKYRFAGDWYVSAHGGWFGSRSAFNARESYRSDSWWRYSAHSTGNGWYAGVGAGYDLTPNVSLGVNYDNYHVKSKFHFYGWDQTVSGSVGMYSAFAEYRFR